MAQDIFDDIDPSTTSGSQLATLLNDFKDAYRTSNSGDTSRPTNLDTYGTWIKYNDPDDGILTYYLYDGTQDIELYKINKTTANVILSSSEDEFNIIKNSDDALGPDFRLKKGRVAGGGQTTDGDILGNIHWVGRDGSSVEYTQARITVTSMDDVVSGARGANIAFYVTQEGGSSLVKAMTISDEKKIGIGVDDPTKMLEVYATDSSAGIKATIAEDSIVAPSVTLHKKRVASSGQVLSGDAISNFESKSTDNAGSEIASANIKAVASENHLATQGGTNIIIQRVKIGETALSDAVTITSTEMTIADNLVVTGNMTVNGTTTTIDTTNTVIKDANIVLNNGGDDASSEGSGVTVERTGTDGSIIYADAATSKFKVGALGSELEVADISSTQIITGKTLTGNTIASLSPDGVETLTFPTATDTVVTLAETQTLTNKSITSTARLDAKQDTEANLITYAGTASNGQFCFATDTKKMYQVVDSALEEFGGGGAGDADTLHLTKSDDIVVGDIDLTGNAGDFDGGGTLNGTVTLSTTSTEFLQGESQVIKYDANGTDGSDDYFGFTKSIPLSDRGKTIGVQFSYKNDTTVVDDDMRFCFKLKDGANAGTISYENLDSQYSTNNVGVTYKSSFFVPEDCTEIEYGWQNTDTTTTIEFFVDNILITANPFIDKNLLDKQEITLGDGNGFGSSSTKIRKYDTVVRNDGPAILTLTNSATLGTYVTANRKCVVTMSISDSKAGGVTQLGISLNSTELTTAVAAITKTDRVANFTTGAANHDGNVCCSIILEVGDDLRPHFGGDADDTTSAHMSITAIAEKEAVSHSGELDIEFVDFNTLTGFGSTATRIPYYTNTVQDTSDKLISVSNSTTNGLSITALQPITLYMSLTYSDDVNDDLFGISLNSTQLTTGIESITVGDRKAASGVSYADQFGNASVMLKLNIGDEVRPHGDSTATGGNPARHTVHVMAIPSARTVITPLTLTAYLKDVKANNTDGGAATTSYSTRTLNEVTGDTSIVTLSSNQFTLGGGKYLVHFKAPGLNCSAHKAKLYDITNTADIVFGSSVKSSSVNQDTWSEGFTTLEITSPTVYEIQHIAGTATATLGFGGANNLGDTEIYTQVKITKVK